MVFRHYVSLMVVATLTSFTAWLLVLFLIPPAEGDWLRVGLFALTLFGTLLGLLSLLLLGLRVRFHQDDLLFRHTKRSVRQACLLSILFVGGLLLSANHALHFSTVAGLFVGVIFVELFAQMRKNGDHVTSSSEPSSQP